MTDRGKESQILVIPATSAQAYLSQAERIVHCEYELIHS